MDASMRPSVHDAALLVWQLGLVCFVIMLTPSTRTRAVLVSLQNFAFLVLIFAGDNSYGIAFLNLHVAIFSTSL